MVGINTVPLIKYCIKCYGRCIANNLPQNGIPCGDQVPLFAHTLLAGPSSSNPLSQLYSAIVPSRTSSEGLNLTVLWAGAPGNPQSLETEKKTILKIHSAKYDGTHAKSSDLTPNPIPPSLKVGVQAH